MIVARQPIVCNLLRLLLIATSLLSMLINPSDAQPAIDYLGLSDRVEDHHPNLSLYKRIRTEENKKVLTQLLHDIADIQKRCRDKGYVCDLNQPTVNQISNEQLNLSSSVRNNRCTDDSVLPPIKLLGIVGSRARFLVEPRQIKDAAVGEQIYGAWIVTEITPDIVVLAHSSQPQAELSYRIEHAPITNIKTDIR